MKIVVYGSFKRTGAVLDGTVVDLSYAYAKYLRERTDEPSPARWLRSSSRRISLA